ncbi:hypothetical protein SALWKB12_2024 [Snodgrassella communis]|uniref:Uncharacterized protein n=1 Tax=Snodgrassella communis TaxID=2946699 RepID=A0A836MPW6_9NEIS|nr:hypothetical protein SALWKB12_2024 [Snodgrassella communis]KDN14354.1 hypothetical protein SALWKB29_1656 [Snodgrassella communis]
MKQHKKMVIKKVFHVFFFLKYFGGCLFMQTIKINLKLY